MAGEIPSKRAAAAADGDDRLSALPDELLHSIMFFLMARQVVQTSVLSRRWRHLWRSTPCLDIDHGEFNRRPDVWRRLLDFTYNLFSKHSAPVLERFRLHLGASYNLNAVDDWVRRGIECRPAAPEITMSTDCQLTRPLLPAAACRLTRMRLCRVRLEGSFTRHLRSGFPVLEDLALARCDCLFQEMVSPTLKCLSIDCCGCSSSSSSAPRTVKAPALASFRLIAATNARRDAFLVVGNGAAAGGSSLVHASITVSCGDSYFVDKSNKTMFTVLGSLCNVTTLELWRFSYLTLMDVTEKFPKLHNLTTLLMGKCEMSLQFGILRVFLKNIPSLEKITLKHCKELRY
ncbi:hypothetical protein PVAP13_7KG166800 [Panicum virgatum]|uniref:F-box domain-containing protein n=1 Tax=Panicum virgatum TaxID=38727 RepID=A0A8T0QI95_PANVG|nr:hypothetical protein PVAP13_7KG166800 [Panicum virgatum]